MESSWRAFNPLAASRSGSSSAEAPSSGLSSPGGAAAAVSAASCLALGDEHPVGCAAALGEAEAEGGALFAQAGEGAECLRAPSVDIARKVRCCDA